MPRFTINHNEVKKIVEVSDMHWKALDKGFLIKVQTLDGQIYETF